jgi:mycothiol synthase
LQLRAPVPAAPPAGSATSDGSATPAGASAFRPGIDDAEWLRVNGRAFAFHPEQGSVSQSDLEALTAEPWFDADDFLLLRDGDALIGYCWLKVEDSIGEFYVVGVDPDRQGEGLGRRLMAAGFARLADRGIRTAALYVDADNAAAVGLYRSLGFTEHAIDIQYAAR